MIARRQWAGMTRRATRSSWVPVPQTVIECLPIAVRVPNHRSHLRGVCALRSACSSSPRQGGQRPCWTPRSRNVAVPSGGRLAATPPCQVIGQRRVVRRRGCRHHPVSDHRCPGELAQVEAGGAVSEHPFVLPGRVEHAEAPGYHSGRRLVRMRSWPTCRCGQSSADPPQRVVAQFGQQLAVRLTASGDAQKVHALLEVRDLGLVLPARAIAPAADLGPLQTGCSGSWPGRR